MASHKVKLRWGILGVAKINERLLPAFAKAYNAELVAISSRSLERAKEAAAAAGIRKAHRSYDALLSDPEVDAVYIPLPNTLHAEWARRAAAQGKHILCEKPLTPTAAEATELVAFCRSKGVQLMDGFMWPHHPRTARIRQFLDAGTIGPIQRVTGAFTFLLDPLTPENIRLQPALAGGSLLDVGCYPVYGIRWAFGMEPARAYATAHYMNGVDVEMSGLLFFKNGGTAAFDCGFTSSSRGWLEITGTKGVVHVPQMWVPAAKAVFEVHHDRQPVEIITLEEADQVVHMIEDFGRAVLQNVPVLPLADEAVKTLRVLDALARSAREGRDVEIQGQ